MNIEEENKAKEFYIKSAINGIHTPRTNMVEINYLDMLKLMHSYSEEVVKNLSISGVVGRSEQLCEGLHSTDFNGKCFKCGEQVFVREPK